MKQFIPKNTFIIIIFVVLNSFIRTQTINYNGVQQINTWTFYTGNHKLSKNIALHTEYQYRRSNVFQEMMQSLIRVGIDYNFTQDVSSSAGYAFADTWAYGKFQEESTPKYNHYRFAEHRIWQQFITKQKIGRFYIQNRFRVEQRWIEHKVKNSLGIYVTDDETISGELAEPWKFRHRARFRYMIQIPLNHKEMVDKTLFLQASDEVFINFGKGVKFNIFDQNRFYLALGWRFNQNCNIQMGYLNQFIEKNDGIHKENNHTGQISFTYNLDFTKK